MLARRLLRRAASAQRRVAARRDGEQTRRAAVLQWHCHSVRWVSSGNRSPPPSSHDGDESFADRADRVKHELSVLHSVAVAAHDHEELTRLRSEAQREDLWDDPTHAASILQQLAALESRDTRVSDLRTRFLDAKGLYALAKEEHERSLMDECMAQLAQLLDEAKSLRVELLLAHASDAASCFVEIQAGAGGTESCDWVAMLARMYQRWGERRHFRVTYADASAGEETGFRSVMLRVDGAYAYGWAKTEAGVHRLVRMSPFDSAGRRHTSFAQVRVYPLAVETSATKQSIEIPAKDVRIDTYRSSGAGGQHVNTTDSAVRITHLPTNTVVTCQSDRSQHRNKAEAMDMLRAKLHQRELEQRATAKHAYTQGLGDNAWGSQIRSYVLQPYTLVKDHRTAFSVSDATSVLDGGHTLDRFMEEMLLLDASRGGATDEAHEQD